ncbi:hypothetical protein BB560_003592 [Smittium megazygosporum]|uniref:L-lactate dehydrogenase n=1 Tax=Smittium megazygosporum TaxID=133381 RepID=A0A2T9ZBI5_9FUNG|nr:hypothetical protein BB560_003592 [Smittium megazygosporum]
MAPKVRVAVIGGGGNVGASIAFSLVAMQQHVEILIVDMNEKLAAGQANDIADATNLSPAKCRLGQFSEVGDCDIIVITAGARQMPGEPRSELMGRNYKIMESIVNNIQPIKETACILVVSNPVDVLASVIQKLTKLPPSQVIGSGTFLDSGRLRNYLSNLLKISSSSIHAYMLGEHGDNQFVGWSSATIGGIPLLSNEIIQKANLQEIEKSIANKAYQIIDAKGSTYYGIGLHAAMIIRSIIGNEYKVIPVSTYMKEYDTYMSTPSVVSAEGARPMEILLSEDEKAHFLAAAEKIKGMCNQF